MRYLLAFAVVIALATPAPAWRIQFTGKDFEPLRDESESCSFLDRTDVSSATDHRYRTMSCGNTKRTGGVAHFLWLATMPSEPTIVTLEFESRLSVNDTFCTEATVGCSVGGSEDLFFTTFGYVSQAYSSGTGFERQTLAVTIPGAEPGTYCALRLRRMIDFAGCTDNETGLADYRGAIIKP